MNATVNYLVDMVGIGYTCAFCIYITLWRLDFRSTLHVYSNTAYKLTIRDSNNIMNHDSNHVLNLSIKDILYPSENRTASLQKTHCDSSL